MKLQFAALVAALTIAGCAAGPAHVATGAGSVAAKQGESPREASFAGVSTFDVVESGGAIHLLFGRPGGEGANELSLSYVRSDDGGATWSEPVTVPTGHAPPAKLHRGDDVQIAARGGHVMALWTARGDGPYGSGGIATALSDDGGRTWRQGPSPAAIPLPADATPSRGPAGTGTPLAASHQHEGSNGPGPGYRFPAAAAGDDGFHVVWIHAVGEERSLRHAVLPFGSAAWSEATVVDPHICACCWNELKAEPDGTLLVLYRDQQPSDMRLATSRDGGKTWRPSGRAGQFDWQFDGCPHVGGGVASVAGRSGGVIATAWTGNGSRTGAYVLRRDGSGAWSSPTPLAADGSAGRNTDVAITSGRAAAVVWDQPGDGGQAVFAATSTDGGIHWSPPSRQSPPGQNAAYPRVVPTRDGFLVLWTVYGAAGELTLQVRSLR